MDIAFENIPTTIRKPGRYMEFNTKLAVRSLASNEQTLLLIGQRRSTGTLAAGVATDIYSADEAELYFGAGSMLHQMAKAAIKAQPYVQISCMALDDAAAGVAATGTITLAGTAASAGTLNVWIGNSKISVGVGKDDLAADLATAVAAEIIANPDLPVTASVAGAVVTLTARHKGALGNQIKVSTSFAVTTGMTATVAAMSGGATDPDITDVLAAVYAKGYTAICNPFADNENLGALSGFLTETGGPMEQRGAFGVSALTTTLASATTLASDLNDGRISLALLPGTKSLPWEVAAAYAAVAAGEEDPARPLNTLALTGIAVPEIADRLSRKEQEKALHNGVTPLEVGADGKVQIVRAITTYTTNAAGVADVSLLDLTTIRTLDYTRKAILTRIGLRFPRSKLSSRTPELVREEILDVLYQLEALEILENIDDYLDALIVQRNSQDANRLDASIPADVVNGLHVFAGLINLYL